MAASGPRRPRVARTVEVRPTQRVRLGPENEEEWGRLRRAIRVAGGFALFLVSVYDFETQQALVDRVRAAFPERPLVLLDLRRSERPVLRWLFGQTTEIPTGSIVVLQALVGESGRLLESDFWVRFNERRNVWRLHNPHTHLWFVDAQARRRVREEAPDLYSIRSPDFLFTLAPSLPEGGTPEGDRQPLPHWTRTADELLAEAAVFADDPTATGRHLYARALSVAVQHLAVEGRLEEAEEKVRLGLSIAREQASSDLEAQYLIQRGNLAGRLGQLDEARAYYERAADLFQQERDNLGLAYTLRSQGDLAQTRGTLDEAKALYLRAETLYQAEREPMGLAYTCAELARVGHAEGEATARDTYMAGALTAAKRSNMPAVLDYVNQVAAEIRAKRLPGRRSERPFEKRKER